MFANLIYTMEKADVFIDGSNFYFKLKQLVQKMGEQHSLLDFRFQDFCAWLTEGKELVQVHYYIGALKQKRGDEKSERMYANQQRLIGKLQQQQVRVVLGHIIQHPDKSFHEKGVDVRLAIEMIRYARINTYDHAYLLSSDTDLVPAVEEVQSFTKKVHYVGTSRGQSFGLTKECDDTLLLRPSDVEPFFTKKLV